MKQIKKIHKLFKLCYKDKIKDNCDTVYYCPRCALNKLKLISGTPFSNFCQKLCFEIVEEIKNKNNK